MQIHIGKEIERVYENSGMKLSEFAKRINTSSRNVYSIFERPEIKTDQLAKIGAVLRFNFFSLYTGPGQPNIEETQDASYTTGKNKITITLELDGKQDTLEEHIRKIKAINALL